MAWFIPGVNILATIGMLGLSAYGQYQADKQYRNSLDQYNDGIKREKLALAKNEEDIARNTSRKIAGATHGVTRSHKITNSVIDELEKEKKEAIDKQKAEINKIWDNPRAQAGKNSLNKTDLRAPWARR